MTEPMTLREIARAVGGKLQNADPDRRIDGVSIDTRTLAPGRLFCAIAGDHFDGHDFLDQARERGAAAFLLARPAPLPNVILVKDTRKALLDLAGAYRARFRTFLVGVTGSVGKTSTKEMIAAILASRGKTLKTEGNLNNEIGLPMTMFRLDASFENAVVEMGMSGLGEISALSRACRPSVGVITNIGVSHLEALGSRENILKAKLEIVDGMAADAPLVLNADNDLLSTVSLSLDRPVLYYGLDSRADVTASDVAARDGGTSFVMHYYGKSLPGWIPVIGRHNVSNALAGFCVGLVAGVPPEDAARAMRRYKNAALRQNMVVTNGVTVIADCYNASPDSMRSALDVLGTVECAGQRVCVFGDMLELGAISEQAHLEVGREVARSRADRLVCFGERARGIYRGALLAGMKEVRHFTDPDELAEFLGKTLRPGDAVIYKASRGMALEEVIARAAATERDGTGHDEF